MPAQGVGSGLNHGEFFAADFDTLSRLTDLESDIGTPL